MRGYTINDSAHVQTTWASGCCVRERGVAMLLVLLAVTIATILSMSFLSSQATSLGVAQNVQGHAQARSVAESALGVAINYVQADADWRTDKAEGQWVSNASFNGGTFDLYAYDGLDTDGDGVVDDTDGDLADDASDPVTLKVVADANGVSHTVFAVVTVGEAAGGLNVLLVVGNASSPTTQDTAKQSLLESWGHTVTLISDHDSQSNFDAELALNDVVYVTSQCSASSISSKLTNASIGAVYAAGSMSSYFSLATNGGYYWNANIDITDNSHYITSPFSTGSLAIGSSSLHLHYNSGTIPSGAERIAERVSSSSTALMTVDVGGTLNSGTAAGRRVKLPWGGSGFNINDLNSNGETILQRSLVWAGAEITLSLPIARWALEETSGTTASDSMSLSNGTYRNSPTLGQPGTNGLATRFDGSNDFIEIPHDDAMLLDDGSISFWFNPDNTSGHQAIFSKDSSGYDTGGHCHIYLDGSRLKVRFQSTGTSYTLRSSSGISSGGWHHGVFTFGSGGMALYLDGVQVDTDSYTGGMGTTSGGVGNYEPIAIGAGTWSSGNLTVSSTNYYYDGLIDDVRIYDSALGAGQVSQIYSGSDTEGSGEPQLIALYVFQEVVTSPPALVGHWLLDDAGGGGAATQVYWVRNGPDRIQSANTDGSNIQDIVTGFEAKYVDIDVGGGKLYWYNKQADKIQSSNLGGTGVVDIATGIDLESMVVDTAGGKVYWAQESPNRIMSANLDGSGVQTIASSFEAERLAVDPAGGKLYWYNDDSERIERANLDGSSVQTVASNADVESMVLDPAGGKIYWSQEDPDRIRRANLDGSSAQTIATGFEAKHLVIDTAGGKLYWHDKEADRIQRANLDGSGVQTIAAGAEVESLAVDPVGGTIYWSQESPNRVYSANLDGTGAQLIASGIEAKELILNNGGVVATDDIASNNGSFSGGATGGATGNGDGGTAAQFGGVDGYIEIPHNDSYLLDSAAVSFWFKADDTSGHQALFSKDSTNFDTGGHLHIYLNGSTLRARLQSTSNSYTVQASGISAGTWYHAVVSWGSGGLRIFTDGVERDTDSYTGGLGTTSGGVGNYEPIVIGAGSWTSGNLVATPITYPYNGVIDDVKVFDKGLNESQAAEVFAGGEPGAGVATTVYDTSDYGTALDLDIGDPGNVTWVPGGGLRIDTATCISSASAATKLYNALTDTDQMSLAVQFTPADASQSGPARIVSYSGGPSSRNFTFGQEGDEYVTRLRTSSTTSNGTPSADSGSVLSAGTQEYVIVSYDGENITMYREGGATVTLARTGTLNWDSSFRFMLGDEITGGRNWLGTLHRVAIYDQAFNQTQADNTFGGGDPGDGSGGGVSSVDWIER